IKFTSFISNFLILDPAVFVSLFQMAKHQLKPYTIRMESKIEIVKFVRKTITDAQKGHSVENPKIDFKQKWFDLKTIDGQSQFLKDVTAIANTSLSDGYIIIGVDDKDYSLKDSRISDSGMTDVQMNDLIRSK